jgi:hypothetical protein
VLGDGEGAGRGRRQGDETGPLACFASAVLDVGVQGLSDRCRATETAQRRVFSVAGRESRRNLVRDRVVDVVAKFGDQALRVPRAVRGARGLNGLVRRKETVRLIQSMCARLPVRRARRADIELANDACELGGTCLAPNLLPVDGL